MITRVVAKNFLSWDTLDFELKSGVTLIDGWNEDDQTSEGSGKSAILNAICWCLYGKIPKEANIDDVIKEGEKTCKVEVQFDDGAVIVRSRKPNDLTLQLPQRAEVTRGKDARETQTMIEDFIALSFETFCQTVYFAQNYNKKFITSNQEEKGKILSEVQDLAIFDKAGKEVRALIKLEEESLLKLRHSKDLNTKDVELLKLNILSEENKFAHALEMQQQKAANISREIEKLSETITYDEKSKEALTDALFRVSYDPELEMELTKSHQETMMKIGSVKSDISGIDRLLSKKISAEVQGKSYATRYKKLQVEKERNLAFLHNPTQNCPTCGTQLESCDTTPTKLEIERIDSELASITETLTMLSSDIEMEIPTKKDLNDTLIELQKTQLGLEQELSDIRSDKSKRSTLEAKLGDVEFSINRNKKYRDSLYESLSQANAPLKLDSSELERLKNKLNDLNSEITLLESCIARKEKYLSELEELKVGFKEIKSYVFNSVLNEINARVHKYLSKLFEVPVLVKFRNEDMKIETDVKFDGTDRGLGLLSGGQFRRVSLAVDLALSDVITARKGSKVGITIWDEYMKDLSEQSMEKVLEIFNSRNQPTLLIEHNSLFKNIVTNSVLIKLENGTSRVEI